jgi:hypothetical protein
MVVYCSLMCHSSFSEIMLGLVILSVIAYFLALVLAANVVASFFVFTENYLLEVYYHNFIAGLIKFNGACSNCNRFEAA